MRTEKEALLTEEQQAGQLGSCKPMVADSPPWYKAPVPVPADIKGPARKHYRDGYRAGKAGWAVMCGTRKYEDAFWRGYDDGLAAAGNPEVRPFEKEGAGR